MSLPKSHPRYQSLLLRDKIVEGVKRGITSLHGLTAHGRGETFDYLLGEKTRSFAIHAIDAAAAMLVLAKHPIISVNGNTAALVPGELVTVSQTLPGILEVNLFHASLDRERKIAAHLKKYGSKKILLPGESRIPGLESNRRKIHPEGQAKADVIFVPLEDGDRTEALIKLGKKVITVDLNPLSRTAQKATITIVDNIVRALPLLIEKIKEYKTKDMKTLEQIVSSYNNNLALKDAEKAIRTGT